MRQKKFSLQSIAETLGRAASTIFYELKRNAVKGAYDARKAQQKSSVRRKNAKYQGKKIAKYIPLRIFVEDRLMDDQSPYAIAGRIRKKEKHLPSVSKESIYRYIKSPYGRNIEIHRQMKRRRSVHDRGLG